MLQHPKRMVDAVRYPDFSARKFNGRDLFALIYDSDVIYPLESGHQFFKRYPFHAQDTLRPLHRHGIVVMRDPEMSVDETDHLSG